MRTIEEKSPKLQHIALFQFPGHLSANFLVTIKTMKNLGGRVKNIFLDPWTEYVTFLSMSCISNVFVEFLLRWHSQIWV